MEGARSSRLGSLGSVTASSAGAFDIEEVGGRISGGPLRSGSAGIVDGRGEDTVFVAVGRKYKESKLTLMWAVKNVAEARKVVLVHVHSPDKLIPVLGGWFPPEKVTAEQVRAHRLTEQEKMHKTLDKYVLICREAKKQYEKLVIETDDVARGLVELIVQHQITRFVMGAAADKHYSKKMKVPKSKTATTVNREAPLPCNIWFICKGILMCSREAGQNDNGIPQARTESPMSSQMASSSVSSSSSGSLYSRSSSQASSLTNPVQQFLKYMLKPSTGETSNPLKNREEQSAPGSRAVVQNSPLEPYPSSWSGGDETVSIVGSSLMFKDKESEDGSMILCSAQGSEGNPLFSLQDIQQDHLAVDDDLYGKLQQALTEAANLKDESYDESRKRRMAEREAVEAIRKAKNLEMLYYKEMKLREQTKEALQRENLELINLKHELEEMFEELKAANEQKSALEMQIKHASEDYEQRLVSLQKERDELLLERDYAVREAKELRRMREEASSNIDAASTVSLFSYAELEQATRNFQNSLKIGEGGYGKVYKGFLRHTTVAIKILHSHTLQGQSEFYQEVEVLSRVRHPKLVTLVGACSEAGALIYEFLPNGSLEDRLSCVNNTPPLSWQSRIRISAEICSALIFLHSNKPHLVVHGDLKPGNVLLDANFECKLSDFGISRLLIQSAATTTFYHRTEPKGTFAYMDPEFLTTGELTPKSDIYSFGIILLRLLTGMPPLGIVREVQEAVEKGTLQELLDTTAGDWPFVQALQLAHLGLRCCELSRSRRPNLVTDVWKVLQPMTRAALGASSLQLMEVNKNTPSYFLCPILQEIMTDPHVAADGFTYEAEALKGWLESGHDTSPMTNVKLSHNQLIPNHALRSAIHEWLQEQNQPR